MADWELGTYLRACREKVRPADVGVPHRGYRRVAGLRREEVAMLAEMSVDYYTRLEQGRERHPSTQVLEALSRAFGLDNDARDHLYRLADFPPRVYSGQAHVSPDLLRLLDAWPDTPAFILNRTLDILARNRLGAALYSGFAQADNLIRMSLLDPVGRAFFLDWERALHTSVANLRLAAGFDPHDPRLLELVAELTEASPAFTELWSKGDVRGKTHEPKNLYHPDVGELNLSYQTFDVRSAPGQQLIVYQAEPESASAHGLKLLGSLAATREDPARPDVEVGPA